MKPFHIDKIQQIIYNHGASINKFYALILSFRKGLSLTTFERRQSLIELLKEQPGLRVPMIAQALRVSEGTVRNDLNALEEDGLLTRVRGGAVLRETFQPASPSFSARINKSAAAKQMIARWAADLVEDGDSILLDASTTVYQMARFLKTGSKLRVITNGVEVARLLARNPTNTVILLAGVREPGWLIHHRPDERAGARDLHIQTAFVSGSGFTLESGLTEVHIDEAQLKRQMIASRISWWPWSTRASLAKST